MKFLLTLLLIFGTASFTVDDAYAGKGKRRKRAEKRAGKQKKRAEKACGKGKARKCERLKRKAAANEYAAKTGDFKGKRQMKRRDRKMRRGKKACRKGKQRKCDRLVRKAQKHDCLLKGGDRKGCRQAKRRMRKDQRAYRQGFSDNNVTAAAMGGLAASKAADRGNAFNSIECRNNGGTWLGNRCQIPNDNQGNDYNNGPNLVAAFQLLEMGCRVINVNPAYVDNVSYFANRADCMMAHGNLQASNCAAQGGQWDGRFCVAGGMQGRSLGSTYNKASRFVPVASGNGGGGARGTRSVIKGSVSGGGAPQRTINTFGNSVNNTGSQSVSGSLNGN
jgi:hypothetical protein